MGLSVAAVADIAKSTLQQLHKEKYTQLGTTITEHHFANQYLKRSNVDMGTGSFAEWRVNVRTLTAARETELYDVDTSVAGDTLQLATAPWVRRDTHFVFDVDERSINSGGTQQIIDLVKVRRANALIDLIELAERQGWSKPASSADTKGFFGFPYWIVANATAGFNGGNPAGFTAGAGGIDSATYDQWRNYTDTYTALNANFMASWRTMCNKTEFMPPAGVSMQELSAKPRRIFYVNNDTLNGLIVLKESQNENVGDLGAYDGDIVFRKMPVRYVPQLDGDTTNPLYQADRGSFKLKVLKGAYFRETVVPHAFGSHNLVAVFTDLMYQFICFNRRLNGLMYKVA